MSPLAEISAAPLERKLAIRVGNPKAPNSALPTKDKQRPTTRRLYVYIVDVIRSTKTNRARLEFISPIEGLGENWPIYSLSYIGIFTLQYQSPEPARMIVHVALIIRPIPMMNAHRKQAKINGPTAHVGTLFPTEILSPSNHRNPSPEEDRAHLWREVGAGKDLNLHTSG